MNILMEMDQQTIEKDEKLKRLVTYREGKPILECDINSKEYAKYLKKAKNILEEINE